VPSDEWLIQAVAGDSERARRAQSTEREKCERHGASRVALFFLED